MAHVMKAAFRHTKDFVNQHSVAEARVREATSNDPWGAPQQLLIDIAESTFKRDELKEVMDMLFKRMNDSSKYWRHVTKALNLLDFLIKNGSEQVVDYASRHLAEIKTLKEFQYVDEDGKDQGVNVRIKSKDVAALLTDPERIKEERAKAKTLRERMAGRSNVSSEDASSQRDEYAYSSRERKEAETRRPTDNDRTTSTGTYGAAAPTSTYGSAAPASTYSGNSGSSDRVQSPGSDADEDLKRALDVSKQTFEQERQRQTASAEQLNRALERSRIDDAAAFGAPPASDAARRGRPAASSAYSSAAADPFGSDFGAPAPAPVPKSNDPFGDDPFGGSFAPAPAAKAAAAPPMQADPFASFGAPAAAAPARAPASAAHDPFGASNDPFGLGGGAAPSSAADSFDPFAAPSKTSSGFDAAFDGGKEAKALPHQLAGKNDPNARLAEIARNAPTMDPFARLGDSRAKAGATASLTTTAPVAVPTPSGAGYGGATPANSFNPSPFSAPTPANSYSAGANFPPSFGMGGPTAAPYGAPAASPFGAAPGAYGAPAANPFGAAPAAYGARPANFGAPPTNYGAPPTSYSAPAGYGAPAAFGASAAFGAAPASNDPFGDPFGGQAGGGGGDILLPQNANGGQSAQPVVVAGAIVDLSASSLAAKGSSKNPFGAPATGKHQWDKPKPNVSLNELKQTGPSTGSTF